MGVEDSPAIEANLIPYMPMPITIPSPTPNLVHDGKYRLSRRENISKFRLHTKALNSPKSSWKFYRLKRRPEEFDAFVL
jgi:hypothetical protein